MTYNVSFDICGVVILFLIWLILQRIYVMNSKSNKLFRRFVVIALIAGILDIGTAYTIIYASLIPAPLNMILNTVYNFLANLATYAGARYAFSTVKFKTKLHDIINHSIIALYAVLLAVNLFTGILFDFRGRVYNKGVLYYVTFGISILLIVHFALVLILNRRLFTKKQLILFSSFIVCPIIFVSIQLVFSNYLMTVFSSATGAFLMLFAIETPDFTELEYLRKNLEHEVEERTQDLTKLNMQLERKNAQSKRDLDLAAHVQQALYSHAENYLGWDIALKFEPQASISGDLYDFYVLAGKFRGFGLFDVSGHGISSGLVTVLAKDIIFREFRNTLPLTLSEAMSRINDSVIRVKGAIENYLTGVICRIDPDDNNKIELANAGAPYPVFKGKNKKKSVLITPDKKKPQYGMIGIPGIAISIQSIPVKMNIGDTLVLYTDGLTEAEDINGVPYGTERIMEVLDNAKGTSQEILDALTEDFKSFIGEKEVVDDITVMVIKCTKEQEIIEEEVTEELESVD